MGVDIKTIFDLVTGKSCPVDNDTNECALIKELRDLQEQQKNTKLLADEVLLELLRLHDSSTSRNMKRTCWELIRLLEDKDNADDVLTLYKLLEEYIAATEIDKQTIKRNAEIKERIAEIKEKLGIE